MSKQAYEDLSSELEYQYSVRIEELKKYENFFELNNKDDDFREIYNKMLIVMLYSYFEGFCRKAFLIYVDYINNTHEKVNVLKEQLVAATLYTEFQKMENSNYKPLAGAREIKEDGKLQKFARRVEFVSEYVSHMNKLVEIPEEIASTEANLRASVLKKIMYNLALDYEMVSPIQSDIDYVVNYRNTIAHGDRTRGIEQSQYNTYRDKIIMLMKKIKENILMSFKERRYLRIIPESV